MSNNSSSKYKWYILTLGTATHILVAALPYICMSVLFQEISKDLGLNLVQVGMIWGIEGFPGLFTCLFVGMLVDRFGIRRSLFIACLFAGSAGALRGLALGYHSLLGLSFLYGLAAVPFSFIVHKSAAEWFSGKQLGFANGVLAMGMGAGNALGSMFSSTVIASHLGGWRKVFFIYGAVAIIFGFFWLKTRKPFAAESGSAINISRESFLRSFKSVICLNSVWMLALIMSCFFGSYAGVVGYLPLYLRNIGWSPVAADGALAALTAASVAGVLPLSFLSDRMGSRKQVLYPAVMIYFICVGLLAFVSSSAIWPIVMLLGLMQEGVAALLITTVMETEGVGAANSGTAFGIIYTLGAVGNFVAPPLGNRMAEINLGSAFLIWAGLIGIALVLLLFVKDTGWKKAAQKTETATE
jgi:MFS transporter, ACS family, D-galactonate transporter